jgi:small subunit ribosomal protein S4
VARYTDGLCRICRREGMKLFLKGERCHTDKCSFQRRGYAPGQHGQARKKPTPYSTQLREKQKVRRLYGMLEKQFELFFERANAMRGVTGDNLLRLLETRLDSVCYRAGFAVNRNDARQLVRHGHVNVNGRRVSIPSFIVKAGDVVEVRQKSVAIKRVVEASAQAERFKTVRWLDVDRAKMKAVVSQLPDHEDLSDLIPASEVEGRAIRQELIVELYSK